MRYAVVIERGARGFGAYVPDLPGCVAVAKTRAEVVKLIHRAIAFHIEGLKKDGEQRTFKEPFAKVKGRGSSRALRRPASAKPHVSLGNERCGGRARRLKCYAEGTGLPHKSRT